MNAPIRINGRGISEEDISREMQYHPAPSIEAARYEAAVALSVRELLLAEAVRLAIGPGAGDGQEIRADDDRIAALLEREVECPQPTEAECRAWYARNPQRFRAPSEYEVSHILRPAPNDDADARARARNRCRRILSLLAAAPDRFEELARIHSRCPSAKDGGRLGTIGPGQTSPEFERALERLPVGEIAAHPLETRYGFHIVLLHARRPGRPRAFEEVHERIASYLRESVWRRAVSQYIRVLAGRAEIHGIDLDAADSPLLRA
jgi:peptidyl-prolyl cis-trans isomerase C